MAETMVLANFWPTRTCWVSKSMYLSWEIHWWPVIFHINQSRTRLHQTKTKNKAKTMVWQIFELKLRVGYKKTVLKLGNSRA